MFIVQCANEPILYSDIYSTARINAENQPDLYYSDTIPIPTLLFSNQMKFPEKQDLLRNMMGLLGNVAEVPHLRSHLMTRYEVFLDFTS